MKRWNAFVCVCGVAWVALAGVTQAAGVDYQGKPVPSAGQVFSRGLVNIATGWVELPRNIVYEGARFPLLGVVWGALEGAGLTVGRAVAGVVDLCSLGQAGEGMYGPAMPYYVWDQKWGPPPVEPVILVPALRPPPPAPVMVEPSQTVWLVNPNGSKTPVVLRPGGGGTWVGPNGEVYTSLPTADQLRPLYGLQSTATPAPGGK
ncbi:MAG: hypothetical protein A3K19_01555 [Lentisphaerae bacterium RIFOXYB12_FULL_65_16]|nr:MAG: hypothetical protein A3K18_22910 [Lentisphaerae bacterium RIFOXYA12_64_32]OGV92826.1 MAG: hypothetical protein A3K19_01555 [Lentisphaerae bacterium RIFOXYB12_FULL_65_16]